MICYSLADIHSLDSVRNLSQDFVNLQVQVFQNAWINQVYDKKSHDSRIATGVDSSSSSLGNAINLPIISMPLSWNKIDSSSSSVQGSSSSSVSLENPFEISNVDGLEFSNFCHPCTALTTCHSSQFFWMEAECDKSDATMKVDPDPPDPCTQDDIMKLLMAIS
jgi:hypothetical protein